MNFGLIWFLCGLGWVAAETAPAPASSVAEQASAIMGEWREIEPGVFEKSGDGKTLRLVSGSVALGKTYDALTRELALIEQRRKVTTDAPADAVRYQQMVARHEHLAALLTSGDTALLDPRDGLLDGLLREIVVQVEAGAQQGVARINYNGLCQGLGTVTIDFSVDHVVTRHRESVDGFAFARQVSRVHPIAGRDCLTFVSAFLSGCDENQQGFELYVSDQNDDCAAPTNTPLRVEIFERVRAFDDTLDAAFRAKAHGGSGSYQFDWTVTLEREVRRYQGELMKFKVRATIPPSVRLVVQDSDGQILVRSFQVEADGSFKRNDSVPVGGDRLMMTHLGVGTAILKRCKLGSDVVFHIKASVYGGHPPYRYEWEEPSPFEFLGRLDQNEAHVVVPPGFVGVARVKVTDLGGQVSYGRVYLEGETPEDPENPVDPEDRFRPGIPDCVNGGGGGSGGRGDDVDMEDPIGPEDGQN